MTKDAVHNFNVMLTLMSKQSGNMFVSSFVSQGFSVQSAASKGTLFDGDSNSVSYVLCIKVGIKTQTDDVTAARDVLRKKVEQTIDDLKIKFYSFCVYGDTLSTWSAGNIKFDSVEENVSAGPYRSTGKFAEGA